MSIAVTKETAPSYWACYLINGDCTHMDDREIAACDRWAERMEPWYVVGVVEDSERFTWSYRLHGGNAEGGNAEGGNAEGGDVCDYVMHRVKGQARLSQISKTLTI